MRHRYVIDGGQANLKIDVGDMKIRDLEWADEDHILLSHSITFDKPLDFKDSLDGTTYGYFEELKYQQLVKDGFYWLQRRHS